MGALNAKFAITEDNLALRRQFIRLDEHDRQLLSSLVPWIKQFSSAIAKEFYDWQFSFAPTRRFFEEISTSKGLAMPILRKALEKAQSTYMVEIFSGAKSSWGEDYFEKRLKIGMIHDEIDLPFKWYIGSYMEYFLLMKKYLKSEVPDAEKREEVENAILKVFNYDTQAIGDSFLLNTLTSMGMSV